MLEENHLIFCQVQNECRVENPDTSGLFGEKNNIMYLFVLVLKEINPIHMANLIQKNASMSNYILNCNFCFFSESSDLEKLVKDNPSSNFFIDEAPVSDKSFPTETLAQISKKIAPTNYLWIACLSEKTPDKESSNLDGDILSFLLTLIKIQ